MTSRQRKRRRGRAPSPGRRASSTRPAALGPLLRRTLASYFRALPRISLVTLAAWIPAQLALAWILARQGVASAFWQEQYQGLADLVVGSLVLPALYSILLDSSRGEKRAGLPGILAAAYGSGAFSWPGTWLGMFMTRFLVSFIVSVALLPALAGAYVVGRLQPEAGRLVGQILDEPDRISSLLASDPGALAPLLLATPLLALPVLMFLRYALAEVVVALERIDGFEALERSRALALGARGRVFLGVLLLDAPSWVLWLALSSSSVALGPYPAAAARACCLVVGALTCAFLVQVYLAQGGQGRPRERHEGAEPPQAPAGV